MTRGTAQKVAELRGLADEQKKYILSLRSQRDEMDVLVRDVETARRAYDGASGRVQTLSLESQNTQANLRLLSPAIEPYAPARPRVMVNIVGSIAGGLLLGGLLALGLELLDRRIRDPEDMAAILGVPVIGVLRPIDSKRPVFRRMTSGGPHPPSGRALLAAPGAR